MKYAKLKTVLITLPTIIVIALLARYIWLNRDSFTAVQSIPPCAVVVCLLLSLLSVVLNASFIKFSAEALGVELDLVDWLGISACSGAIGLVMPLRMEIVFKGAYYKAKCGLSYGKFVSLMAGGTAIQMSLLSLETAVVFFFFGTWLGLSHVFTIAAIVIFGCVILFLFITVKKREAIWRFIPFKKYTSSAFQGFMDLLGNKKAMIKCVLSATGLVTVHILRLFVLLVALGVRVPFYYVLFFHSVIQVSDLFSILPGNIGIRESLLGLVYVSLGDLFRNGLMLSLLLRVLSLATFTIMAGIFVVPVIRRIRN